MAEVTGVVQEIKAIARGGKTVYDIVVGGQSYGAGFYAPKCKQGDYIKFTIDDSRGYQNVARGSLKVSSHKPPAEAVAEAQATAPVKTNAGGTFDSRQDIISRQSASNSAIAFLQLAQAADALGLPASAAKGKKQEVLEAMLKKYTQMFYEFNTGAAFKDISPNSGEASESKEEEATAPDVVVDTTDDPWS